MKNDIRKCSRFWMLAAGMILSFAFFLCLGTMKLEAADKTYYKIGMNDGVWISENENYYEDYAYVRFCPKKTGAITFSISNCDKDWTVPVKLMKQNSIGEYVSVTSGYDHDYISNNNSSGGKETVTYAVKKGVKYALRVEPSNDYYLNSEFHKVGETGGKKKSSAKKLKKGKAQYGLLYIGKTQSRWYKYKVPKTKTVTIQFKGWGNNYIAYDIMVKGMKTVSRSVYQNNWDFNTGKNDLRENNKAKILKAKLKKGTTIYIEVYAYRKDQTGYYMLKCK